MAEDKLHWELEKLKLEVQQLGRRFFEQPSFWISLLSFTVAVGGVFTQNALSSIRSERAELDRVKSEHMRDSVLTDVTALNLRKDALSHQIDSLQSENVTLAAVRANLSARVDAVEQATLQLPIPTETRARITAAGRASYSVAGYCYSVSQDQCQSMQAAVREKGYTLIRGALLDRRPAWLAPQSTVFYYDPGAAADARELAQELGIRTGATFSVASGGGLGVSANEQRYSLRVHFVGS